MLLTRLSEHADKLDMPPSMYDHSTVRWFIELDLDGTLIGFTSLTGSGKRPEDGRRMLTPNLIRSSGIRPKLLVDNGEYVLGIPRDPSKQARVADAHHQFKQLVRACAEETRELAVIAVDQFLRQWEPEDTSRLPRDFDPAKVLAFRVGDVQPIDLPAVREFWADYIDRSADSPVMTCLVCGKDRPVERRLPVKLKRVPGGQTAGTAMISANAEAFESYGLKESIVAPTCRDCGERFAKVANHLIESEDNHLYVGSVVYIFWTRHDLDFSPVKALQADVRTLSDIMASLDDMSETSTVRDQKDGLKVPFTGGSRASVDLMDPNVFYAVGLSGSGGRVVVRDWFETTVLQAKINLSNWVNRQRLIDHTTGLPGTPLSVFALAASMYHERETPPGDMVQALIGAALAGRSLPLWILSEVVKRNRREQRLTRPRAVLTKLALLTHGGDGMDDKLYGLDVNRPEPAYHCGRLLAQFGEIQRSALPGIKQTVTDRYFGAASSAPASVFGVLLRLSQAHLAKLRKEKPGVHYRLQESLEEIMVRIHEYPATLDMKQQALFGLGMYHQRAQNRKAMIEAKKKKGEIIDDETSAS